MYYMEHPDNSILAKWLKEGKDGRDLYQPVDGGHPSQTSQVLWAKEIWNTIESKWPQVFGNVNPYNKEIEEMFGSQGGY